jgi:DNA-binding LacI/PurR family transcriptional regulator
METEPYYRHIYNILLESIVGGKLSPGDKVPSEKELCKQFQVSRITSKRALGLLMEQGYINRFPGRGSFVAEQFAAGKQAVRLGRAIGYVVSDFSDNFGTRLLFTIEKVCAELGYHLILKRTRESITEETSAISSLIAMGVDGLLLLPVHGEYYNEEILKLILEKKPLAFVDRKMRGLSAPSFSTDNITAAKTGAEYLLELGHRNIAFYSGPIKNTSTVEDRHRGFIYAHAGNSIPINENFFYTDLTSFWTYPFSLKNNVESDIEKVKNHLLTYPDITAAFAVEYKMAIIVKAAAEQIGRRIPDDLSILTFDSALSIAGMPSFTHLLQDEEVIGRRAMETLHTMIGGQPEAAPPNLCCESIFPARLIPGLSTAEIKSG